MTNGKICSQTSHATLGLYKDSQADDMDPTLFAQWSEHGYPQETLKATSYGDLLQAHEVARTWGFSANLCHDAGRTQVSPMTGTVCAIGPASYLQLKYFLDKFDEYN